MMLCLEVNRIIPVQTDWWLNAEQRWLLTLNNPKLARPSITPGYTSRGKRWWRNASDIQLHRSMGKDNVIYHAVMSHAHTGWHARVRELLPQRTR